MLKSDAFIGNALYLLLSLVLLLSACHQNESVAHAEDASEPSRSLPKLVDIGADKCIPCIKMAPILEQLHEDYLRQMDVVFIDVWKNREAAAKYGIKMIPTQIFYAADGQELFRHTGFYSREEILGKWRELGYAFEDEEP